MSEHQKVTVTNKTKVVPGIGTVLVRKEVREQRWLIQFSESVWVKATKVTRQHMTIIDCDPAEWWATRYPIMSGGGATGQDVLMHEATLNSAIPYNGDRPNGLVMKGNDQI